MTKEKGFKARVAWVLRAKLNRGESLSDSERDWLDEYTGKHRPGRPRKDAPEVVMSAAPPIIGAPEFAPPPISVAPPQEAADDDTSEPAFTKAAETEESKSEPVSGTVVDEADEKAGKRGEAWADKYCEWMKAANRNISSMGGFAIPDIMIDEIKSLLEKE